MVSPVIQPPQLSSALMSGGTNGVTGVTRRDEITAARTERYVNSGKDSSDDGVKVTLSAEGRRLAEEATRQQKVGPVSETPDEISTRARQIPESPVAAYAATAGSSIRRPGSSAGSSADNSVEQAGSIASVNYRAELGSLSQVQAAQARVDQALEARRQSAPEGALQIGGSRIGVIVNVRA